MKKELPRGIRNNNPLNIRIGNTWLGEVTHPTDNEFEQFVSMKYGCRAAFVILRRYIRRYGLNTIPLIISRWAPMSENNVKAYVEDVCKRTRLSPEHILDYRNEDEMVSLVMAMAHHECGTPIREENVRNGYLLA